MTDRNLSLDDYYVKAEGSGFIMSPKVDYAFKLVFGSEAYDAIKVASMSKEAKMAYEARVAEIMDSKTREHEAREAGKEEGKAEGREEGIELTKKIFKLNSAGYKVEEISEKCNIPVSKVKEILE